MNYKKDFKEINPDQINDLTEKMKAVSHFHIQIKDALRSISSLIFEIDKVNNHLSDFEYLFTLLDKEEKLKSHFGKSFVVLNTFKNFTKLSDIANQDLQESFDRIYLTLKDTNKLLENKLKLENTFNKKNQTNNNN